MRIESNYHLISIQFVHGQIVEMLLLLLLLFTSIPCYIFIHSFKNHIFLHEERPLNMKIDFLDYNYDQ